MKSVFFIAAIARSSAVIGKAHQPEVADDASLLKTMQLCTPYKALKASIPPYHDNRQKMPTEI